MPCVASSFSTSKCYFIVRVAQKNISIFSKFVHTYSREGDIIIPVKTPQYII